MEAAWFLLHQSVQESQSRQRSRQSLFPKRNLSNAEVESVKRRSLSDWDEGRILQHMKEAEMVEISLENNTYLRLCLKLQDSPKIQEIAGECNAILQWLGVPPGFRVYLWWIDWPRRIQKEEWPSRVSVNGGWAMKGNPEVFVYRIEEWQRVLIHETIHALEWDWHMPTKPLACWGLGENAEVSPHLFEAWTELYAEWLFCGWFNIAWAKQRAWQDEQALQILARHRNNTDWKENTNIFAYYVLKACLAPHIAFVWSFGNGQNEEERYNVLCSLVQPRLKLLRELAKSVKPREICMCMTVPKIEGAP
jgi:hypothetical protein